MSTNPKLLLFCLGQSNKKPIPKPEVSKAGSKAAVIFTNINGHLKLTSKHSLHSGLILDMVTPIMPQQIFIKNWKKTYICNIRKKAGVGGPHRQAGGTTALHSLLYLPINFLL